MEKKVEFVSKGCKLRGVLRLPAAQGPHPLLVMAGGWCYVKEIVMPTAPTRPCSTPRRLAGRHRLASFPRRGRSRKVAARTTSDTGPGSPAVPHCTTANGSRRTKSAQRYGARGTSFLAASTFWSRPSRRPPRSHTITIRSATNERCKSTARRSRIQTRCSGRVCRRSPFCRPLRLPSDWRGTRYRWEFRSSDLNAVI